MIISLVQRIHIDPVLVHWNYVFLSNTLQKLNMDTKNDSLEKGNSSEIWLVLQDGPLNGQN